MSELNILNATIADPLGPDYGYQVVSASDVTFQPRSGSPYIRQVDVRGRVYQLSWNKRLLSTRHSLEQWEQQYRDGFFTFFDAERNRFFSGRFQGPLTFQPTNNDQWNISGIFMEIPNLPMSTYPTNWARDAILQGTRDEFGGNRIKVTGPLDALGLGPTLNYLLQSEAIDVAPWANSLGGTGTAVVITPNAAASPFGDVNADQLAFPAVGAGGANFSLRTQAVAFGNPLIKSKTLTFSIWLRAAAPLTLTMIIQENGTLENTTAALNVTAAWQRFSVTKTFSAGATGTSVNGYFGNLGGTGANTVFAWGAQMEFGAAASPYAATGAGTAFLIAPNQAWDRRTKNYLLNSQRLDKAPWVLAQSGAAASVITADNVADPTGALTAEKIDFAVTAAAQYSGFNQPVVLPAFKGQTITFSIYLYSAGVTTINIIIEDNASLANTTLNANVTTGWTRFSVTLTLAAGSTATAVNCWVRNPASQAAKTIFAWGAQVEYGSAPSTYAPTTTTMVALPAPLANTPFLLRDIAWWNDGTDVGELAEIEYIGYGFRLYAPLNADQGIVQLTVTRNGVIEVPATLVDLYSAAVVNSAIVSTQANLRLGKHRVTLAGTNTKNAGSSGFNILFDAIEIMR